MTYKIGLKVQEEEKLDLDVATKCASKLKMRINRGFLSSEKFLVI